MASRLSGRPVRVGNSAVSEAPSRSRRRSCRSSLLRWWTIKRPSPGPKLCRHFEGESLHEQAFLRPHRHNPHVGIRHHRTLHQRRHGALLRDAGCVFADDCRLVDRRPPTHQLGRRCPADGVLTTATAAGHDLSWQPGQYTSGRSGTGRAKPYCPARWVGWPRWITR